MRPSVIVGALLGVICIATVGFFATFAPTDPRPVFWMCMADVLLIELTTGASFFRSFTSIVSRARRDALPATYIAIGSTAAMLALVGLAIDATFLARFTGPHYDRMLVWLIIGRWLLLAILVVPMLLGDRAHQEARPELAFIQQERRAIIDAFEVALTQLRHVEVLSPERDTIRRLTTEADATRNRMRGWASGSTLNDTSRIGHLVERFASQVHAFTISTSDERAPVSNAILATLADAKSELTGNSIARLT